LRQKLFDYGVLGCGGCLRTWGVYEVGSGRQEAPKFFASKKIALRESYQAHVVFFVADTFVGSSYIESGEASPGSLALISAWPVWSVPLDSDGWWA